MQALLLPAGAAAVLVQVQDTDAVLTLAAALRAARDEAPLDRVLEVVPAATTVLVRVDDPVDLPAVCRAVGDLAAGTEPGGPVTDTGDELVLPVEYDGADLAEVSRLTGLSEQEVVAAHTGTPWRVGFVGFAPGFAYLIGGDPRLQVPRRSTPRTVVPAGSVGLAGSFSGIYPRPSPGGWQLLGRTDAVLWDVRRDPPALLTPGRAVRFTAASGLGPPSSPADPDQPASSAADSGSRALEVLTTGPLALVQDLGRPGLADIGVGRSGAADRASHRLGARLLAQDESLASVELVLGGLTVRARGRLTVALTGAPAPARLDGRPVPHGAPVGLEDGQVLELGTPAPGVGVRTYLSVRGGVAVPPVLGSRSRDTLADLGPEPLRDGVVLPVGPPPPTHPQVDQAPPPARSPGPLTVAVLAGPRAGWITDPGTLDAATWTVTPASDRVGVRLSGPRLQRAPDRDGEELPSEPLVPGAVQVPPDGQPVIFLADHPVTGGYPVVAVVTPADLDVAAQAQPGERLRFRTVPEAGSGRADKEERAGP